MLNNRRYIGVLSWGRTEWKRSAANSSIRRVKVLEQARVERTDERLRIVSNELWQRAKDKPIYNFTLTSGDAETNVARQLGQVGKDDRIYALDKNEGTTSSLYGMLTTVSYDDARSLVIKAVEGRSGVVNKR